MLAATTFFFTGLMLSSKEGNEKVSGTRSA